MLKTKTSLLTISISVSLLAMPASAQDANDIETLNPAETPQKRVVRVVEAIPMWVDSEKLRIRDNPYAGDVIGMLEMGQKIKVHQRADNWIRISSDGKPAKWVNSEFLSKSRVSWSNYEFGSRSSRSFNAPYDVDLKRIKIKELKDMKIYAAHIKSAPNSGRVVITRHDFRSGPYYEKRIVHCGESGASHVRMLGEGYNYLMMEKDPRGAAIAEAPGPAFAVKEGATSALSQGIAEFTCKAKSL